MQKYLTQKDFSNVSFLISSKIASIYTGVGDDKESGEFLHFSIFKMSSGKTCLWVILSTDLASDTFYYVTYILKTVSYPAYFKVQIK